MLDLAGVSLSGSGIAQLVHERWASAASAIMGLEGADPDQLGPALPPLLKGGAAAAGVDSVSAGIPEQPQAAAAAARAPDPRSLLIESPIRSGQSSIFPYGDVTVLGSVSSGAEVVAGGSIHIYGALRGRAMAGSMGNATRAHFLRQERSRADRDRRLLPDRGGDGRGLRSRAGPVLARGHAS